MSLNSISLINFFKTEVDTARENPHKIRTRLEERKFDEENQFQHSLLPNIKYKTEEGQQAVDEAI